MTIPEPLHRARALTNIGLHDGLPQWAYAVELQRSRLQELQAEGRRFSEFLRSSSPEGLARFSLEELSEWTSRLVADSHFLLVAVRHVLQLARHLRDRTSDDHRADALLKAFLRGKHGRAEMIRGILEHFDRYWIEGKQDRRRGMSGWPKPVLPVGMGDKLHLHIGANQVDLLVLADDALGLAHKLYEVWSEVTPWEEELPDPTDPPDDLTYLDELLGCGPPEIDDETG